MHPLRRALVAAARLLVKARRDGGGDPNVEALAAVILASWRRRWEKVADDAVEALIDEVRGMADELPTPDIDAASGERDRQRILDAIVAALVATLEARASAPPPAALASLTRQAAVSLALNGARSAGLTLDLGLPEVARALAAAERDLPLLVGGRAASHRAEVEAVAQAMLTSRAARSPAAGPAGAPALPGAPATLEDARAALRAAMGADARLWLADAVWAWAYRWNSVGAFLAARATGVALYVWNNPPRGPDKNTTPFCRWLHGRQVSVGRARLQVDQYVQAVASGDLEGAVAAWPLDRQVDRGGTSSFALTYAQLGLPPYHWGCRDVLLAEAPERG